MRHGTPNSGGEGLETILLLSLQGWQPVARAIGHTRESLTASPRSKHKHHRQSSCSPIARMLGYMHNVRSKAYSSLGVVVLFSVAGRHVLHTGEIAHHRGKGRRKRLLALLGRGNLQAVNEGGRAGTSHRRTVTVALKAATL